jgi:hypothetical protein
MKKLLLIALLIFSIESNAQYFIKAYGTKVAKLKDGIPTLSIKKDKLLRSLESKLKLASHTYVDCSVGKFEDGYFISFFTMDSTRTSVNLYLDGAFLLISGTTQCTSTSCNANYTKCQVRGKACTPCDQGTNDCKRTSSSL